MFLPASSAKAWFWISALVVCAGVSGSSCLADENEPAGVRINDLSFSPDGRLLIAGGGAETGEIAAWQVASWQPAWQRSEESACTKLAFSPDGARLAIGRQSPVVRLLDAGTGEIQRELQGHKGNARAVAFTPDGRRVVSAGESEQILIHDSSTGTVVARIADINDPDQVNKGTIVIGPVHHVTVSPDARLFAVTSYRPHVVQVRNLESGQRVQDIAGFGSYVPDIWFFPDGRRLLAPSWDGRIRMFDATTYEPFRSLHGMGGVRSAKVSGDGRRVAAVTGSDQVLVFAVDPRADEPTQQQVRELLGSFEEDSYAVRERAMQELQQIGTDAIPQLTQSMRSGSAEVRWRSRELLDRLNDAASALTFRERRAEFRAVAMSPDGHLVAAGAAAGRICVWNLDDQQQVANFLFAATAESVE